MDICSQAFWFLKTRDNACKRHWNSILHIKGFQKWFHIPTFTFPYPFSTSAIGTFFQMEISILLIPIYSFFFLTVVQVQLSPFSHHHFPPPQEPPPPTFNHSYLFLKSLKCSRKYLHSIQCSTLAFSNAGMHFKHLEALLSRIFLLNTPVEGPQIFHSCQVPRGRWWCPAGITLWEPLIYFYCNQGSGHYKTNQPAPPHPPGRAGTSQPRF